MAGEGDTLAVKEMLHGDTAYTWRVVITTDENILLLRTSRELV